MTDQPTTPKPPAAAPRPAATVLLLRDDPRDGMEVFMVERHHQIDFSTGALVFPGGSIAQGDRDPRVRTLSDGADGLDEDQLAFRVAAIREAFEESGVLLARKAGESSFVDGATSERLGDWRKPLDRGERGIVELLEAEGLRLAVDALVPFAHWITPKILAKRFDTWFFVAVAPEDQVLAHDGRESVDSVWVTPQAACDAADRGERTVIFPTRMNLEKLGRSRTTAEAMATAAASRVVTVEPVTEAVPGGRVMRIPEEAGYGVSEIVLEGAPGSQGTARRIGPDGKVQTAPLAAKITS